MKKVLLLLVLIANLSIAAQHPDLNTNRWFVTQYESNGNVVVPNYDPVSFPFIDLQISSDFIMSSKHATLPNCEWGFSGHLTYNGSVSFHFANIEMFSMNTACTQDINDFMTLYETFFDEGSDADFTYVIITNADESKTLTITNVNGKHLTFTNRFFTPAPEFISNPGWVLYYMLYEGNQFYSFEQTTILPFNLDFTNTSIHSNHCMNTFMGDVNFFYNDVSPNEGTFYMYDMVQTLADYCDIYEERYFDLYRENMPQGYHYLFGCTLCGGGCSLFITDFYGNELHYGDPLSSFDDFNANLIQIKPNPAEDVVTIQNKDQFKINSMRIVNSLGQIEPIDNATQINISHLNSGVYILQMELESGNFISKKLIKK